MIKPVIFLLAALLCQADSVPTMVEDAALLAHENLLPLNEEPVVAGKRMMNDEENDPKGTSRTSNTCVDKLHLLDCPNLREYCDTNTAVHKNCPLTCWRSCKVCTDKLPNDDCPKLRAYCGTNTVVRKNCPLTCDLCKALWRGGHRTGSDGEIYIGRKHTAEKCYKDCKKDTRGFLSVDYERGTDGKCWCNNGYTKVVPSSKWQTAVIRRSSDRDRGSDRYSSKRDVSLGIGLVVE